MKQVIMFGAATLAFCAPVAAFDFQADHFGPLVLHTSERHPSDFHTKPLWPRLTGCEDETEIRGGICSYFVSPSVTLAVVNAIGTDTPNKVLVSWTGDPDGALTLANTARVLGYVLSPGVEGGLQEAMATEMLQLLHMSGSDVPEQRWTIGQTVYTLRKDAHLGSRGDVLLTAAEISAE